MYILILILTCFCVLKLLVSCYGHLDICHLSKTQKYATLTAIHEEVKILVLFNVSVYKRN